MDVSLIIPAYNEEKYIGACLESVISSGARFKEIVVVDNASTDATARIASAFPQVRVVREERKGLTVARQSGFDATTGELVAFIDADCRIDRQWFPAVESHFAQHPHSVSLTGPVWYYDGPTWLRWFVIALEWISLPAAYFLARYLIIGGNFVARRSAIEQIGGFNSDIRFFGEDADLARRLSEVGPTHLRMHFAVATSMRRFEHDGVLRTSLNYVLNFLSHVFFKRSFTHAYTDARP